jgi:hypothetical protein
LFRYLMIVEPDLVYGGRMGKNLAFQKLYLWTPTRTCHTEIGPRQCTQRYLG